MKLILSLNCGYIEDISFQFYFFLKLNVFIKEQQTERFWVEFKKVKFNSGNVGLLTDDIRILLYNA